MENETWGAQHLATSTMLHAVEGLVHIPISRSTHLMPSIAIEAEGKRLAVAVRQRRREKNLPILAIPTLRLFVVTSS